MMTSSSRYNSNNNNFNRGIGYSDFKLLVSLFIKRTKSFLFLNVLIHCMHCLHSLNLFRSILRRSFDWQLYVLILRCIRCTLRAWRPPKPHLIIISIVFVRSIYFKKRNCKKKFLSKTKICTRLRFWFALLCVSIDAEDHLESSHTHTHGETSLLTHTHMVETKLRANLDKLTLPFLRPTSCHRNLWNRPLAMQKHIQTRHHSKTFKIKFINRLSFHFN